VLPILFSTKINCSGVKAVTLTSLTDQELA
jgi:hypothetical protein